MPFVLICHCKAITERDIRGLVRSGAGTRAEVARACRASTRCGGCARAIERIVRDERRRVEAQPAAETALAGVSIAAAAR